ncbi:MAG: NAD(P)-dependent oxidoreductase [Opitutaceae bacterium]|nr:NAD(P)-dependent oxidoreductase [Opitutaceae bacterium]
MTPASSVAVPPLPCLRTALDDFLSEPTPQVAAVVARHPGPFLVLGAGGKIGLHLATLLRRSLDRLGRADRVVAVSRFTTLRDRAVFEQRGIETLSCDLADQAGLILLPDAPTVFFLAGVKFGTAASSSLLQAINVEMPARVAARFSKSRIVAFSTGCVYPFMTPASGGATEETPPRPVGEYAVSCLARERAFAAAAAHHGNPVVLIRLNYAVEFRYGVLVDIAARIMRGEPVDVTTGHVNVIWQRDAVAHSIQALDVAAPSAPPLNVTGPDALSVRDLAHRFGAALGRPARIVGQEADTAWLNNASASHRRFGSPATPLDDMIRWISAWVATVGETWGKPTGYERRDGRF